MTRYHKAKRRKKSFPQKEMQRGFELTGSPRTAARQLIAILASSPQDVPDSRETSTSPTHEKQAASCQSEQGRAQDGEAPSDTQRK